MDFIDTEELPYSLKEAIRASTLRYNDDVKAHLDSVGKIDYQFSVTSLNKSPRQLQLLKRHGKDITLEFWDRLHLIDGSIFHYILESHPDPACMVEKRMGIKLPYKGKTVYIHGATDVFDPRDGSLTDYKRISLASLAFPKDDYEFQLNCLAWIIEGQQGEKFKVKKLRNFYSIKDWRLSDFKDSQIKGYEYPRRPAFFHTYERWDSERFFKVLKHKILRHIEANDLPDKQLPYCSNEERWKRDKFRVIKKTQKGEWSLKSTGSFNNQSEADLLKKDIEAEGGEAKVEVVEGTPVKCIDYCDVCLFCNQRQAEIKQQNKTKQK